MKSRNWDQGNYGKKKKNMKRVREKTRSEYYGRDEAGGGDQYRRKETIARQEGFERGQQCTRRLMSWWGRKGGLLGGGVPSHLMGIYGGTPKTT